MAASTHKRPSLAPRNWVGWLAAGALWLLGRMPHRLACALVAPLGPLLYLALGSRRRIAARNLEACFPEWPPDRRRRVLRASFGAMARMLAELAWCWSGPRATLSRWVDVHGMQHLEAAIAEGRGVLVVSAHFTCLEVGGRAVYERIDGCGVYRRLGNEVLEWYQNRGRAVYTRDMLDKNDLRGMLRALRRGLPVWYAPDQDFGPRESQFVPFFGIQAATLLATARLPELTGCRVLTMLPHHDPASGRYRVDISAPLEGFPGADPQAALARINAALEAAIRQAPEQYWWVHRRFKSRPPGEPPFYGAQSRPRHLDPAA